MGEGPLLRLVRLGAALALLGAIGVVIGAPAHAEGPQVLIESPPIQGQPEHPPLLVSQDIGSGVITVTNPGGTAPTTQECVEGTINAVFCLGTFFFFATPGLPETVVHARDWHFLRHFLQDANPPYTPEEMERYVEAWSQPGASAAMIDYYRASVRQSQKEAVAKLRPISAPTLVIWGERDSYLGSDLAEPHSDDVPNLDHVERLPDASHWVHHDEAERVNQLLIDFFSAANVA
jgi:pimeloyl-ACP methyl ester carboxylesterase